MMPISSSRSKTGEAGAGARRRRLASSRLLPSLRRGAPGPSVDAEGDSDLVSRKRRECGGDSALQDGLHAGADRSPGEGVPSGELRESAAAL